MKLEFSVRLKVRVAPFSYESLLQTVHTWVVELVGSSYIQSILSHFINMVFSEVFLSIRCQYPCFFNLSTSCPQKPSSYDMSLKKVNPQKIIQLTRYSVSSISRYSNE